MYDGLSPSVGQKTTADLMNTPTGGVTVLHRPLMPNKSVAMASPILPAGVPSGITNPSGLASVSKPLQSTTGEPKKITRCSCAFAGLNRNQSLSLPFEQPALQFYLPEALLMQPKVQSMVKQVTEIVEHTCPLGR